MASHLVTPYELTATRQRARKNKDTPLLLSALGQDVTVDLLDVVDANICSVEPYTNSDKTGSVRCVERIRSGDSISMVFDSGLSGQREVVHDGSDPNQPVVFTKNPTHVASSYSVCLLWRPPTGNSGILLMHSPWGRGGSKGQVLSLLQRAVNREELAKAKLKASAMVPAKALERILRQANATKITYSRSTGVSSTFGASRTQKSAPAELDLVVKGTNSIPFRDELTKAVKASANRDKLFSLDVRDDDAEGGYRSETFDDVTIEIPTSGGVKSYSMKNDSIPSLGFNLTSEINDVYYGLPDGQTKDWPPLLLEGVTPLLTKVLAELDLDS